MGITRAALHWRSEQGSASVEFVFVGILLTFLTLGVLQLALTLHVRNTVQDAAAEGARWAALADSTPSAGASRAAELITAALGAQFAGDIQVTQDQYLGAPAMAVTVRTSLPLVGLWGPASSLEVTGHAATEIFG